MQKINITVPHTQLGYQPLKTLQQGILSQEYYKVFPIFYPKEVLFVY